MLNLSYYAYLVPCFFTMIQCRNGSTFRVITLHMLRRQLYRFTVDSQAKEHLRRCFQDRHPCGTRGGGKALDAPSVRDAQSCSSAMRLGHFSSALMQGKEVYLRCKCSSTSMRFAHGAPCVVQTFSHGFFTPSKLDEPRPTRAPPIPGSDSDRAQSDWTCLAPRSIQGDGSPHPARVVLWSVRETDSGTRAGRALVERETAAHLRLRWERRDGRQLAQGWRAKDRIPTEMDRTGWWQGRAKSTGSGSKPSQKDSQRSISGCIGVPSSSRAPHMGMETCRSSR